MRILHLISTLSRSAGGPVNALEGLACEQVRLGEAVSVVSVGRVGVDDQVPKRLREAGVVVTLLDKPVSPFVRGLPDGLVKAAAEAEVMHLHGVWEGLIRAGIRAGLAAGCPVVFRPCGMLDPWSMSQKRAKKLVFYHLLLKGLLKKCAAVHCTARTEAENIARFKLGVRTIVEPNGVDLSLFRSLPQRGHFRGKYPQIGERPIVLFMSRLHPKKGLELLIPAMASLGEREFFLAIAGPGEKDYEASIQGLLNQHGLSERSVLTGPLYGADKAAAMADSDLFVLPSFQENFGVVVAEAMAAGLPALVSDQVALYREVTEADAGAVFPLDVGRIAQTVGQWLDLGEQRRQAGARGRQTAMRQFDWSDIARRWQGHYGKLITA